MNEHRFQWEVNVWRKGTEVGDFSHVSVCEGGDGRKQANHVWEFQCVFPKEISIIKAASMWKVQKIVGKKETERVINPMYNSVQMSDRHRTHPCRTQTANSWAKSKWPELWSCVLVKSLLKTLELYRKIQFLQFSSHRVGTLFQDGSEHEEHGIYNSLLKTVNKDWPAHDSDVGTIRRWSYSTELSLAR